MQRSHDPFRDVHVRLRGSRRWSRPALHAFVPAALLLLAGCSKVEAPPPEAPRPVRAIVVGSGAGAASAVYSGEIRARYETRLGFRTSGKVVVRLVEVGSHVRAGQPLLRMDVVQETLQLASSDAEVEAAQSRVKKFRQDVDRTEQLLALKFASQAELDAQRQALTEAEAGLRAAQSRRQISLNQHGFSELRAERNGVVTALAAEVGQVVSAGVPVVSVAVDGEREVQISVPESRVDELRRARLIRVSAWALPGRQWPGTLRELAPDTDNVTRTYLARIAVHGADPSLRLGMTASVQLAEPDAAAGGAFRVPLTAIYDKARQPQVWVIDRKSGLVALRRITLGSALNDEVWVSSGLTAGETVVTAGVHLLTEGQKVSVLQAAAAQSQASEPAK